MRKLAFHQVDVFGDMPLKGNALAVVVDGDELSDATMADRTSASAVRGTATPEGFCGEASDTSRVAGESRPASASGSS